MRPPATRRTPDMASPARDALARGDMAAVRRLASGLVGQSGTAAEGRFLLGIADASEGRVSAGLGHVEAAIALAPTAEYLAQQARLLILRAAWSMDRDGNKAARVDVSAIKIVAARLQTRVLDRAIQVFGAAGLTEDTPLAYLWTWGRALRFIDGPDEVHLRTVANAEIKKTGALPKRH